MILDKIINKKEISVGERKRLVSEAEIYQLGLQLTKEEGRVSKKEESIFKEAIKKQGLSIIGEFKKASPSKGIIVEDFKIENILRYYESLKVDSFSILTEEVFFLGSDDYLKEVKAKSIKPVLRKDFIIDPYQLYESRILGADAVLLISAVLKGKLKEFYMLSKKLGLEALVEVHNEEELDLALSCGCEIIGINNRDLKNFNTSIEVTKKLIKKIPKDKLVISESGIRTIEDLKELLEIGVDGVLIGEMFMRNIDNKEFTKQYMEFLRLR